MASDGIQRHRTTVLSYVQDTAIRSSQIRIRMNELNDFIETANGKLF